MGWRTPTHDRGSQDVEAPAGLAPFDPSSRERLEWRQPSGWKSRWELVCRDQVVARLTRRGAFRQKTTLEFADASWSVKERWNGGLVITPLSGAAKPAKHCCGFLSGTLRREGLPEIKTRSGGFWHPYWELVTKDDEQSLVRVNAKCGLLRAQGEVEISDAARRMEDVELLVGVNWLVAVTMMRQSSSAAAGA